MAADSKLVDWFLYDIDLRRERLRENNMIWDNQTAFGRVDSYIKQLLSIGHEIYRSFDDNLEVRSIFLGISKVFAKVWHKSHI